MQYGRYEIIKELGKGGMGVVYQAHDPQIDRPVALKVLREDRVVSEDFVLRFFKEAKFIGRLSHPNIVTVYDVGRDHGTIYIAMEYLQGQPFNEVIRSGRLSIEKIIDIALQVANALGYAHEKGIVHRDIKPSNIILTDEGNVKLTDFGIARAEDSNAAQQTQTGVILGTPFYMSPEQVMGKRIDGRSDLFSLGVILYELIVDSKPFEGDHFAAIFRAITDDIPVAPLKIDASIPQSISDLIMKALSKNPDERFQTGKEMGDALKTCLQVKESLLLPEKPISPQKKACGICFNYGSDCSSCSWRDNLFFWST
jgi:serine/threonine-protein kinase